jgi:glycosyltransferase involved in cell wall biosynthesis
MLHNKKVVVVLPAYHAARTLEQTCAAIPREVADEVLLVDDGSSDDTVALAQRLGIRVFVHQDNLGYGANQKTCYREALRLGADIVVMLHPDYQYDPRLITAMAAMVASDLYDVVLGSRILGGSALRGGMPRYKYVFNRLLTLFQNVLLGAHLSEYHTGYRAFSRKVLEAMPLLANSDDFVFDNQILTQAIAFDFRIGEISCPTKYFPEASSISFRRSVVYVLGVLATSLLYRLWRWRLVRTRLFSDRPTLRLTSYYRELAPPMLPQPPHAPQALLQGNSGSEPAAPIES